MSLQIEITSLASKVGLLEQRVEELEAENSRAWRDVRREVCANTGLILVLQEIARGSHGEDGMRELAQSALDRVKP